MKCEICELDAWHVFPKEFTESDEPLRVCMGCGYVCYWIDPASEEKIKEYYRKEYRRPINPDNLITASRKMNYIQMFLKDWLLAKEKERDGKPMIVGDIGCATGYMVNWFRQRGHKATGSEWTISMRRFANHFYGIPITEELTDKHKYDFLLMYHTLEHMIQPLSKLKRYREMLSEEGVMMISTPQWFEKLDEASGRVSDFKTLYPKNHCNVFSQTSIKNMFKLAGLEIIKEDHVTYGQTYLLRKCEPSKEIVKENYKGIIETLEKQKMAIELYQRASKEGIADFYRDALNLCPKFPDAYFDWVMNSTQKKDRGRCAELIDEAFKIMPNETKLIMLRAYFLYQNQDYAAALEDFERLTSLKINEEILMFKAWCLRHLGRLKEAMASYQQAAMLNPQKWHEATVYICQCATEQKAWDEVAVDTLKERLFQQANVQILPEDPIFKENGVEENVLRGA